MTNRRLGRRIGCFGKVKLCMSRATRSPSGFLNAAHNALFKTVQSQLSSANELPSTRGGKLWPFPPFRSAGRAARALADEFGRFDRWLVMPWPSLAPLRRELIRRGKIVLVPSEDDSTAMRMTYRPNSAIPLFTPYRGPVDIAVVACTAFSPDFPEPYALDNERQAALLEAVQEPEVGLHPTQPRLPVVCLASDAQEVENWPRSARGSIPALLVFTSTQVVPLDPELKKRAEQEENVHESEICV